MDTRVAQPETHDRIRVAARMTRGRRHERREERARRRLFQRLAKERGLNVHVDAVVISLGCDVARIPGAPRALQKWDEVSRPGEDLRAADDAIRRRMIAVVEDLVARQRK